MVWAGCREAQRMAQYPGGWKRWAEGKGRELCPASESLLDSGNQPGTLSGGAGEGRADLTVQAPPTGGKLVFLLCLVSVQRRV